MDVIVIVFKQQLLYMHQNEMPDIRHRKVVMQIHEFLKIGIEPQIKITDETLLGLDVDE